MMHAVKWLAFMFILVETFSDSILFLQQSNPVIHAILINTVPLYMGRAMAYFWLYDVGYIEQGEITWKEFWTWSIYK